LKIILFIILAFIALAVVQKLIQVIFAGVAALFGFAILLILLVLAVVIIWRFLH
jgi:hypothetical protein